jgi:molybdopterin molybdotransferase
MKTVREAQEIILGRVEAMVKAREKVELKKALGRVLAEDIKSNRNHPPFDISAMDGYAVIHRDAGGATKENPAVLTIVDDIRAGMDAERALNKGEAARIMTGAPIPGGADTVIRVEDTDCSNDRVKIFDASTKGANIRIKGENLITGETVLREGAELGPPEVGILAMVKKAEVEVYKRPTVAILSTGDELEALDEPFDEKKIPDANSYTVMAMLRSIGVKPKLLGIARDSKEELEKKLKKGFDYDMLIVSGGVSVGHHDFVRPTLKELGIEMHFWRVSLRPGHPFAFGTGIAGEAGSKGGTAAPGKKPLVFGLPGNPVSSMVCTVQFVLPAVRKSMGALRIYPRTIKATLGKDVKDKMGRLHFMRVRLHETPDGYTALPTPSQGSGILMSMVEADGLMVFPAEKTLLEEGSIVTVQLLHANTQEEAGLPED